MLLSNRLLVHYDPKKELVLSCDAIPYGLGIVLSHRFKDGSLRPVAYGSRTLTAAEKNYAHIEREALSIIFGVKHFHKYLYGRKFSLYTDHKPLIKIFGPNTGVPELSALRLQRWSLILMAYDYDIIYRKGSNHSDCDMLSRFPNPKAEMEATELSVNYFTYVDQLPITSKDIEAATRQDPVLSRVM